MIPGPDYIYECPNCGKLLKEGSFASGNTFNARHFSDGSCNAPMLPDFPVLTKCKACDTILNLNTLKEIGTFDYDYHYDYKKGEVVNRNNRIRWKNILENFLKISIKIEDIPRADFLKREDLFCALEVFPQHELYIRREIWWSYHKRLKSEFSRNKNISEITKQACLLLIEDNALYKENCRALIRLLNPKDEQQRIMIAELYRNLGEFDKCVELMDILSDIRYSGLKRMFKEECKKRNPLTFCINFDALKE